MSCPCWFNKRRVNFCDLATQRRWFLRHFELASRVQLPMFLHLRAAAAEFFEILEEQARRAPAGGVVHSFDGSWEEAERALRLPGIFIGLNGCSLKTGKRGVRRV